MTDQAKTAWIAVDWGTTNLRIWALDSRGEPIARRSSTKGMSGLEPQEFEAVLVELVGDLLHADTRMPVIICGMAGSRQGWAEAPYRTVPCAPPSFADATRFDARDGRLDISILPGVKQRAPADVMRGEETQIAGFLTREPEHTGTLCLPGTHTKWVALKAGRIEHFRTCMTGELFALLSEQSVLRHGLGDTGPDDEAFRQAVTALHAAPQKLAADLFGIRAAGLVDAMSPQVARGRLSGTLIGSELACIEDDFDLSQVVVLGASAIARAYRTALDCLGHAAICQEADIVTLQGLELAYSSYLKVTS